MSFLSSLRESASPGVAVEIASGRVSAASSSTPCAAIEGPPLPSLTVTAATRSRAISSATDGGGLANNPVERTLVDVSVLIAPATRRT